MLAATILTLLCACVVRDPESTSFSFLTYDHGQNATLSGPISFAQYLYEQNGSRWNAVTRECVAVIKAKLETGSVRRSLPASSALIKVQLTRLDKSVLLRQFDGNSEHLAEMTYLWNEYNLRIAMDMLSQRFPNPFVYMKTDYKKFLRQYAYNEKLRTKVEQIIAPSLGEIHAFPFIECMEQYRDNMRDEIVHEFVKLATEKQGNIEDDLFVRKHWQFLTRQDGQDTLILVRTHEDYLNAFHLTWDLYLLELTQRRFDC